MTQFSIPVHTSREKKEKTCKSINHNPYETKYLHNKMYVSRCYALDKKGNERKNESQVDFIKLVFSLSFSNNKF